MGDEKPKHISNEAVPKKPLDTARLKALIERRKLAKHLMQERQKAMDKKPNPWADLEAELEVEQMLEGLANKNNLPFR